VSSDSGRLSGGSLPYFARDGELRSSSLGAGLGFVSGQFVSHEVRLSQEDSADDSAWVAGRHGRVELSADGLLSEPALFTTEPVDMTEHDRPADGAQEPPPPRAPATAPAAPARAPVAQGFSAQLLAAAQRMRPAAEPVPVSTPKQEEYT
jgi:hypothetical protein